MKQQINRRLFLKTAAGALAAPCFIPARAFGANDKITLGCIGVGKMGTGNMRNFLEQGDCRVVAVCDTYEERRQKAKQLVDEKYGGDGCAMFGDYRELLARRDIDAVMIAPQDHWHALIATAAAAAGKDMYCEKPLGVSINEGKAIRTAVRKHKRMFQTGTWQRSQGKFRQACEVVRNGHIGKLLEIQVGSPGPKYQPKYEGPSDPQPVPGGFDWPMWRGPAPDKPFNPGRVAWPDWYLIWDYCAGFICNWGVHHLDIAVWGCPALASESCEVEAQGVYRKKGFTDNLESWKASFQFAGGLKMVFTDETQQKNGTKFIGDKGWIHVDRSGIWAGPNDLLLIEPKAGDVRLMPSIPVEDDRKPLKTNEGGMIVYKSPSHHAGFLDSIRSRKDPVSSIDATYAACNLALMAEASARLGTKLKWDAKAEKFTGNDEANKLMTRPLHNGWKLA
jgi:predicted dehydrogenase